MADAETNTETTEQSIADIVGEAFDADAAGGEGDGAGGDAETSSAERDMDASGNVQDEAAVQDGKEAGDGDKQQDTAEGKTASGDEAGHEQDAGNQQVSDQPLTAPEHWPSDDRELFAGQPKEVQQWMLDRIKAQDGDYTKKTQEIAPLRNSIQRWQGYLTQIGQTPEYAFDLLMGAEQRLRSGTPQEKVAVIQALANDYGVPLEGFAPPQGEAGEPDEQQLLQNAINQAIQPYQQQLEQMQGYMSHQQQAATQAQVNTIQQQVTAFAGEKDGQGQLAHPYFNDPGVQDMMTMLAQQEQASGRQPQLQDLYDRAIWAVPAVKDKLLKVQQSNAEQQQRERVEKAKNAGASVSSGGGAAPPTDEQPQGIRESVEQAWNSHANV